YTIRERMPSNPGCGHGSTRLSSRRGRRASWTETQMSFPNATADLSTSLRSGRDDRMLGCIPLERRGSPGRIVASAEATFRQKRSETVNPSTPLLIGLQYSWPQQPTDV